jgi:hypothetical protein
MKAKLTAGLCLPALLAMSFTMGTAQAADDPAKVGADSAQILKKLDADKDGMISKTEADKMKGLSEIFDTADESKDGKLDAAELSKALGAMPK